MAITELEPVATAPQKKISYSMSTLEGRRNFLEKHSIRALGKELTSTTLRISFIAVQVLSLLVFVLPAFLVFPLITYYFKKVARNQIELDNMELIRHHCFRELHENHMHTLYEGELLQKDQYATEQRLNEIKEYFTIASLKKTLENVAESPLAKFLSERNPSCLQRLKEYNPLTTSSSRERNLISVLNQVNDIYRSDETKNDKAFVNFLEHETHLGNQMELLTQEKVPVYREYLHALKEFGGESTAPDLYLNYLDSLKPEDCSFVTSVMLDDGDFKQYVQYALVHKANIFEAAFIEFQASKNAEQFKFRLLKELIDTTPVMTEADPTQKKLWSLGQMIDRLSASNPSDRPMAEAYVISLCRDLLKYEDASNYLENHDKIFMWACEKRDRSKVEFKLVVSAFKAVIARHDETHLAMIQEMAAAKSVSIRSQIADELRVLQALDFKEPAGMPSILKVDPFLFEAVMAKEPPTHTLLASLCTLRPAMKEINALHPSKAQTYIIEFDPLEAVKYAKAPQAFAALFKCALSVESKKVYALNVIAGGMRTLLGSLSEDLGLRPEEALTMLNKAANVGAFPSEEQKIIGNRLQTHFLRHALREYAAEKIAFLPANKHKDATKLAQMIAEKFSVESEVSAVTLIYPRKLVDYCLELLSETPYTPLAISLAVEAQKLDAAAELTLEKKEKIAALALQYNFSVKDRTPEQVAIPLLFKLLPDIFLTLAREGKCDRLDEVEGECTTLRALFNHDDAMVSEYVEAVKYWKAMHRLHLQYLKGHTLKDFLKNSIEIAAEQVEMLIKAVKEAPDLDNILSLKQMLYDSKKLSLIQKVLPFILTELKDCSLKTRDNDTPLKKTLSNLFQHLPEPGSLKDRFMQFALGFVNQFGPGSRLVESYFSSFIDSKLGEEAEFTEFHLAFIKKQLRPVSNILASLVPMLVQNHDTHRYLVLLNEIKGCIYHSKEFNVRQITLALLKLCKQVLQDVHSHESSIDATIDAFEKMVAEE